MKNYIYQKFYMHNFQILLFAFASLLFLNCQKDQETSTNNENFNFDMEAKNIQIHDPSSQANYQHVALKHLNWNATVNFEQKQIEATATWTIENLNESEELVLDTRDLTIKNVMLNGSQKTQFELEEEHELYGRALKIEIFPDTESVTIDYLTSPEAGALQWLNPQQTADKTDPFLFSQSQSILARSWLPCMDGPGTRFTYSADVKVPENLLALMSANNPKEKNDTGEYHFEMKQPIPSYLFAISVGNLEFRQIGDNCGVYSESSVIEKAEKEFEDLPKMIEAAENLYGPYQWEEYDLIVLPPSFPFGGMENPRLTFATPTILAGDKSLTSLVAHELAHSWSGNLVTNANWEDLWLNEGFTTYFENRIMEAIYGREYSEMLASLSYQGLQSELQDLPTEDTKLHINLENRDPDEGMSGIPYDKGYLFLRNIEETIGRKKFDAFLKSYFDAYKFKVMNTDSFIELINEELIQGDKDLAEQLKIEKWIHEAGLPENHPVPSSDNFSKIDALIQELTIAKIQDASQNWSSHEWQHFIESLPRDIGVQKMAELDKVFDFTNSGNSEIQFDWYELAILNNYAKAFPAIEEFLVKVGRRKFLTPLYKAMKESGKEQMALSIYKKARPNYHSVSYNTIDALLDYKGI